MASTSFINLTNELLRELNEVALTSANFSDALGVQQMVKDKVNLAYLDIVNAEPRWPFLSVAESGLADPFYGNVAKDTVNGQRWYPINDAAANHTEDYTNVDWSSFYVTTIGVAGETAPYLNRTLDYISVQKWQDFFRNQENEDDAGDSVGGTPVRVIRSFDNRNFGLSPIPDKVYSIKYFAYKQPTELVESTDEVVFPAMYRTVLLAKARYYIWMFKHNYQASMIADEDYKKGLRSMRENLLGVAPENVTDDRIRTV